MMARALMDRRSLSALTPPAELIQFERLCGVCTRVSSPQTHSCGQLVFATRFAALLPSRCAKISSLSVRTQSTISQHNQSAQSVST